MQQPPSKSEFKGQGHKEETEWPSFRQLLVYLSNLSLQTFGSFFQYIPWLSKSDSTKRGLTPLKDRLKMPEDEVQAPMADMQRTSDSLLTEAKQVHTPSTAEKYAEMRPAKKKSSSSKDPSLLSKHHSSKSQEYAEFYGSSEVPSHAKSKSQKQRSKHRHREKVGQVPLGGVGAEKKEMRGVDYGNPKFEHYNMRTKYVTEDSFRFNPH